MSDVATSQKQAVVIADHSAEGTRKGAIISHYMSYDGTLHWKAQITERERAEGDLIERCLRTAPKIGSRLLKACVIKVQKPKK